jgi:serine phosphatase RsbU (regulator of sigma subunit)
MGYTQNAMLLPKNLISWILLGLAFFAIPEALLFFGIQRFSHSIQLLEKDQFLLDSRKLLRKIQMVENNEEFWCRTLQIGFSQCSSADQFAKELGHLRDLHGQPFQFATWDSRNLLQAHSLAKIAPKDSWNKVGVALQETFLATTPKDLQTHEVFLRRSLGRHFFSPFLKKPHSPKAPRLCRLRFGSSGWMVWYSTQPGFSAAVFFPDAVRRKRTGLEQFVKHANNQTTGIQVFLQEGGQFFPTLLPLFAREYHQFLRHSFNEGTFLATEDHLVFCQRLNHRQYILAIRRKSPLGMSAPALPTVVPLLYGVVFLFGLAFLRRVRFENIRLGKLLAIFLSLATLLPLALLLIFGEQHLADKRRFLYERTRAEALAFAQTVESNFNDSMQPILTKTLRAAQLLRSELLANGGILSPDLGRRFYEKLNANHCRFELIASSGLPIVSSFGFRNASQSLSFQPLSRSRGDLNLMDFKIKLGKAFLGMWNQKPADGKLLAELEIMAEMVIQKPLWHVCHDFLQILDRLGYYNFGSTPTPIFLHVIALGPSAGNGDYLLFGQPDRIRFREHFFRKTFSARQGNPLGVKIISPIDVDILQLHPFKDRNILRSLFRGEEIPAPESFEILAIDGQEWLCISYSSPVMNTNLLVFSPIATIDRLLSKERQDLILFILVGLFSISGLTLLFSSVITHPIALLCQGNQEIQKRNFSYRVPILSNDELGQLGQVFNEAIEDLEELNVAGTVQQKLFPQGRLDCRPFDLFGHCVTLNDLGGDFFDFFSVGETSFALAIGDVAGHGVGAAMLMAYAKAGFMNSPHLLERPKELLGRLHELILSTTSRRQRKVMTMQYLFVQRTDGKVRYTNAGGCSPFLIKKHQGTVEEISLGGAVLGAFKKNTFQEMEFTLMPDEALVFYSDGLVEARNTVNQEMGYTYLKEQLLSLWAPDAQTYYHNIKAMYLRWLNGAEPQDDFTVMVLIRHSV